MICLIYFITRMLPDIHKHVVEFESMQGCKTVLAVEWDLTRKKEYTVTALGKVNRTIVQGFTRFPQYGQ